MLPNHCWLALATKALSRLYEDILKITELQKYYLFKITLFPFSSFPIFPIFPFYHVSIVFPLHHHHHISIVLSLNNGNVEVVVERKQKKCESSGDGGEKINKIEERRNNWIAAEKEGGLARVKNFVWCYKELQSQTKILGSLPLNIVFFSLFARLLSLPMLFIAVNTPNLVHQHMESVGRQ